MSMKYSYDCDVIFFSENMALILVHWHNEINAAMDYIHGMVNVSQT